MLHLLMNIGVLGILDSNMLCSLSSRALLGSISSWGINLPWL
ncbi:hypothetical protein AND4_14581 [Vibrio sp. AND4]|nr:hypothetical protein AND4_14581 [Vibrio sp. AND4]